MIRVPLINQTEEAKFVEVQQAKLPDDVAQMIDFLTRERVTIDYWLEIALMYYRGGQTQKFSQLLSEALKEESYEGRMQKRYLFENESERIKAINVLAGHQLQLMEAESDAAKRKLHSSKGYKLIEEANMMTATNVHNLCSMCFYEITAGQLKQAQEYYLHCEQQLQRLAQYGGSGQDGSDRESSAAISALLKLAKAIIEFARGHVKESLGYLKEMVQDNPRCPSDIWFGIGLCYYRLGNLPKAKLSMDKTVELDPTNSMALTAIGIIEIASNVNDFDVRDQAIKYFERAFQVNPRNPLAINYLAEHYFIKQEYGLCEELCQAAIRLLQNKVRPDRSDIVTYRQDIEHLRSIFYFILGKVEHVQERYETAFQHYEESLRHNKLNYQTLFCLAKVQFHMGNFQAAEAHLNTVISCTRFKDSYEAIRLLAQIKARQSRATANQQEALKLFRQVCELNPHDYDANFEIASLFEQTEPKRALPYYEQGIKIMRDYLVEKLGGEEGPSHTRPFTFMQKWPSSFESATDHVELCQKMIPPELLCNIGVLQMNDSQDVKALKNLQEALANCERLLAEGNAEDKRLKALHITIRFNLACCYDRASRIGEASEMFKSIIREEPSYTDAYMRLAILAQRRGDVKRALDYIDQGIAQLSSGAEENRKSPAKLHCMKGRILIDIGNLHDAYKEYKMAHDVTGKRDAYARIGLANIHYMISTFHRHNIESQEAELRMAMNQYFSVLEFDEMNTAGSLGVGIVLSEYAKVTEAKEIFKVIESSETDPTIVKHAMLNHAHILMDDENSEYAVNLYQACHDRFPEDHAISLYLAKAHYKRKNYTKCADMTRRLLMRHPNDFRLKFNLALCLFSKADHTFSLTVRRVKQTVQATKDLHYAKSLLTQFITMFQKSDSSPSTFLMPTTSSRDQLQLANKAYAEMCRIAESKLTYLNESLQNAEYYLDHDRKQEQEEMELQRERERLAEEVRQRELLEQQSKREEEDKRRKEATEAFFAQQKGVEDYKLVLGKDKKKAKPNKEDELGEDIMQDELEPEDNHHLDEPGLLAGFIQDDGEGDGDDDFAAEKKKKSKKHHKDKSERRHKKSKKDKKLRRNAERVDTGDLPVESNIDEVVGGDDAVAADGNDEADMIGQKRKRLVKTAPEAGMEDQVAADGEEEVMDATQMKRKRTIDDDE